MKLFELLNFKKKLLMIVFSYLKSFFNRHILGLLALWLVSITAQAQVHWPTSAAVPGGVVVLPLLSCHGAIAPEVYFQGKRVMVLHADDSHGGAPQWKAIIGLPLDLKVGTQVIDIIYDGAKQRTQQQFSVSLKHYASQHIQLRKQKPSIFVKRLEDEAALVNSRFQVWSQHLPQSLAFVLPVKGRVSGNFGLRRFYEGKERASHKGIDIAAPTGTTVRAPLAGKVILVGNFILTGHTVLIDHGQGLITAYCHLNKVTAREGQSLQVKQAIGSVGKTGRATGPHLHWGVSLNGVRVEPLLFL